MVRFAAFLPPRLAFWVLLHSFSDQIPGIRSKMKQNLPADRPKGTKPSQKMSRREEEDCKSTQRINIRCIPTFPVLSLLHYDILVLFQRNGIAFVGSCFHNSWSCFYFLDYLETFVNVGLFLPMWVEFYWWILQWECLRFARIWFHFSISFASQPS